MKKTIYLKSVSVKCGGTSSRLRQTPRFIECLLFNFGAAAAFLLIIFTLFFAAPSFAQTLSGIVTDSNAAPIQNAEVSLLHQTKKIAQTVTGNQGKFSIDWQGARQDLLLTIKARGFANYSRILPENFNEPLTVVLSPASIDSEISVSITRANSRLSETPASVVVFDSETLNATAAQMPDDALRQVAGFNLFRRSSSKNSNPTTQGANFRGLSGSGASRSAVTLDGLSLNDAFGGWTYWSRVPRAAIERVEILRGGASAFYGESALSGAVDFMTYQPKEDAPILVFEASAGTQNTFDASVFTAFAKNNWSADLAAETFTTGGYIPVAETERGAADTEADSRHENIFLTLGRSFGANARIFARGVYFTERRNNGTELQTNQTRFRQISFGADLSSARFGAFRTRAFVESQIYDQTFSAVSNDRSSESLSRIQRVPSQALGASALWDRVFGDHAVSSSIEFRQTRGVSDEVGFFGGRANSLSSAGGREKTFAVFAQDFWRVSDKLILNFGGRFDFRTNYRALAATRSLATNQATFTRFPDRDQSAFSPRIAALYQINESFSLYGSFSNSFRAPTLNELYRGFRVGSVVTLPNENLRAERASTFESGVNYSGFEKRLNVRANAFFTAVRQPIFSVTTAATANLITRQRRNVGATRTRGFEIDAEYAPRRALKFSASYLFVDSRVMKFPDNPDLIGNFLPQVARQQLTFQTLYRPNEFFSISLQSRFSGAQFEDDLNALRLRPFAAFDVLASYKIFKKLEIFAAAENIFNERYDIGRTPVLTVAAPRFVRVGLRFDLQNK